MSKVVGEITVDDFDGAPRKFKIREARFSEQNRIATLMRNAFGDLEKNADGNLVAVDPKNFSLEEHGKFLIEACHVYLSDDDGEPAFSREEIDNWGANVRKVSAAIDKFQGRAKTSVDHSGKS